ncbi:MAG: hypothetical protein HY925_16540 [Elusimicrobia bacterium]|nr:hypothetical protein [Elusimicrobiota bacterium]
MRTRPVLVAAALVLGLSAAARAEVSGCASGRCPVRGSLDRMSETAPAAMGSVFENSRITTAEASSVTASGPGTARPGVAAPSPSLRKTAPDVPAPKEAEEKEGGGIGGFLNKHKWQIGGALAGGLASLALGGGLFGLLAGLVISVAVAFIGPKIF